MPFNQEPREKSDKVAGDAWGYVGANDGLNLGASALYAHSPIILPDPSAAGAGTGTCQAAVSPLGAPYTQLTDATLVLPFDFTLLTPDASAYVGTHPLDVWRRVAHVVEILRNGTWYRYPVHAVTSGTVIQVWDPNIDLVVGNYTYRCRYNVDRAKRLGQNHDGINSLPISWLNLPVPAGIATRKYLITDQNTLGITGSGNSVVSLLAAVNGSPTISWAKFCAQVYDDVGGFSYWLQFRNAPAPGFTDSFEIIAPGPYGAGIYQEHDFTLEMNGATNIDIQYLTLGAPSGKNYFKLYLRGWLP